MRGDLTGMPPTRTALGNLTPTEFAEKTMMDKLAA